MGKTHSVYVKDDELNEWIEKQIEDGPFHNKAHLFSHAVEKLRKDNTEDILV